MSRYLKWLIPLAVVMAIGAAFWPRKIILHISFPCDSYWGVPGEDYYAFMDAAIEKFEAEHPNVTVEYTSGILINDYTEWLSGQYLLGNEPDVLVVLPEDFVQMSSNGALRPLDVLLETDVDVKRNDFYDAALQAGVENGIQYTLPWECVPQMMFINQTLLEKEGIALPEDDWTWDEFYSLCDRLTRDTDGDGIIDQFGVYGYGWKEAFVANNCTLFTRDGQGCLLNQSAQIAAVQFAQQIYRLNNDTDLDEKTFDAGYVAFRPMLFSEYRSYEPYPWRIKRSSKFEWNYTVMPGGTSNGGGNYSQLRTLMLGISNRTTHPRLAWEFLKTIACTKEMQTLVYTELSGVSALRSVTESQEVQQLLPQDLRNNAATSGRASLQSIMEKTIATPHFVKYDQAMELADRLINDAMSADKNLDLQLLQIQQQLEQTLLQ